MITKSEICKEYLDKFPNAKTKTLANLIYSENVELWSNSENVRSLLKYIRGNAGKTRIKEVDPKYVKPNGTSGNPFQLPESEAPDWKPVYIPEAHNRVLILSDIHLPYHSVEALNKAIEYGKERKVNTLILDGDIIDFYQASRFVKDPRKKTIRDEIEMWKDFLPRLTEALGSPKVFYKQGNHEERFELYMYIKAPELIGVEEFKLNHLLEFGKYGIEYIDKKRILKLGGLSVLHGHEFGRSVFSPVNPARGVFMRAKEPTIIGHHHQTSEHTEPTLGGKMITTWSMGCLSDLHPEYMPINKHNHGFAYVETDGKQFTVDNKRIYKGEIV